MFLTKVSIGVHLVYATVVETPSYLTLAEKLFSESERGEIVATVADDRPAAPIMTGTGVFGRFAWRAKEWERVWCARCLHMAQ